MSKVRILSPRPRNSNCSSRAVFCLVSNSCTEFESRVFEGGCFWRSFEPNNLYYLTRSRICVPSDNIIIEPGLARVFCIYFQLSKESAISLAVSPK